MKERYKYENRVLKACWQLNFFYKTYFTTKLIPAHRGPNIDRQEEFDT